MKKKNLRKLALLMSMSTLSLNQTDGSDIAAEARAGSSESAGRESVALPGVPSRVQGGLDIEKIKNYLMEIDKLTRGFEDKDVVAVCGGTRVGKGTIINALLGIKYDVAGDSTLKPMEGQNALVPTSSETRSHTLFPAIYGDAYMDLPGFIDNRRDEKKICANLSIEFALQRAKSVKLVGVIDTNSLFGSAPELKELSVAFKQILQFAHKSERKHEMLFLFNKGHHRVKVSHIMERIKNLIDQMQGELSAKEEAQEKSDESFKEEVRDLESRLHMLNLIHSVPERLLVVDPLELDTIQKVKDVVKAMQPVSMKELTLNETPERKLLNAAIFSFIADFTKTLESNTSALESDTLLDKTIEFCTETLNAYEAILGVADSSEIIDRYRQATDDQSREAEIRTAQTRLKNKRKTSEKIITDSREDLKKYDSSEKKTVWKDYVKEEREPFLGVSLGWTEKHFSIEGIPFDSVEEEYKGGTFKVEEHNGYKGNYKALYQSWRGYDGVASVTGYTKKRNLPDMIIKIAELKQLISSHQLRIDSLEEEEQDLAQELSKSRATSTRDKLVRIQGRLIDIKNTITERKREHNVFMESYKQQKDHIDASYNFIKDFSVSLGDSPLFSEFQKAYEDAKALKTSAERELDSDLTCPITHAPLLDAVRTPCVGDGHVFNRLPLVRWLTDHGTCPTCRGSVDVNDLKDDNETISKILDALKL
jgi:GTP-binding protein EngB required for normal cell division